MEYAKISIGSIDKRVKMSEFEQIRQQCDGVILAGGLARRMQGCNKLLQCFDGPQQQLEKLVSALRPQVQKIWINSHRDHDIYRAFDPDIAIFSDIESGFFGPMMGMLSAWEYSQQDWILFIPCDLYHVPKHLLKQMIEVTMNGKCPLSYAAFNQQALYPLCLMHRSVRTVLEQQIEQQQYSLYRCFEKINYEVAHFESTQQHHSINTWKELYDNDY